MVDHHPIAKLRRVVAALERLQTPAVEDAAWLVGAVQRYEAARRSGIELDMDAALGLGQPGRTGWWSDELRERRDRLLQDLHRRCFSDLSPGRAAAAIVRLARIAEADVSDRRDSADPAYALISRAMMTGQTIPAQRQLKRILQVDIKYPLSFPVAMSTSDPAGS